MKVLVTGAAGQVGTDLVGRIHARGAELSCFDIVPAPSGLPEGVQWFEGDVTKRQQLYGCIREVEPDVVFHLAAILSASGEKDPQRAYKVNMEGTHHMLEAAREVGVGKVMFTSTIAVFGPNLPDPTPEDVPLAPTTIYGVTKVAGELLGDYYHRRYGVDVRGVRFPGLISAGIPGGGTTDYALNMYVEGIRSGRYECFVGEESTVPMMYMPDALRALIELANAPRENLRRCIYNIAAMSPTAAEFAEAVRKRVPGAEITFKSDPVRQAILDSWPRRLDDTAAREDWGWTHEYELEAMSDDLVPKVKAMLAEPRTSTPEG